MTDAWDYLTEQLSAALVFAGVEKNDFTALVIVDWLKTDAMVTIDWTPGAREAAIEAIREVLDD